MTEIEKITLKLQEIQADIESLRREVKKQDPQKVEKVTADVDAIVGQAVNECKKLINPLSEDQKNQNKKLSNISETLVDNINSAIHKKVNINFVNNLYRNK